MPYIHITASPGVDLAMYEKVTEALGPEPIDGHIVHIVGESAGTLHIVDVWLTKAHADRFAAERLFPAFERSNAMPTPSASYVAMEGTIQINAAAEV